MQTTRAAIDAMDTQAISHPMGRPIGAGAAPNAIYALWSRFARAVTGPSRGATYAALSALTDRELRDIGLTRGEIRRVYDPEFCARRLMRARSGA